MCPLRFILVFFSAVLAVYLAWKTAASPHDEAASIQENDSTIRKPKLHPFKAGFWGLIDMASGRYLWTNIKHFVNTQHTN